MIEFFKKLLKDLFEGKHEEKTKQYKNFDKEIHCYYMEWVKAHPNNK